MAPNTILPAVDGVEEEDELMTADSRNWTGRVDRDSAIGQSEARNGVERVPKGGEDRDAIN